MFYGVRGALVTYLIVSVAYVPYIFLGSLTFLALIDKILHLVFTGLFAFISGLLADREKRSRERRERERYLAGRAASSIVHDLKSPLIAIGGYAWRIREGKGDIDASVQTIIDSASKMEKTVHRYSILPGPFSSIRKR